MGKSSPEYEKISKYATLFAWFIIVCNIYYYGIPLFGRWGLYHDSIGEIFIRMRAAGFFNSHLITKGVAYLIMFVASMLRTGKATKVKMVYIFLAILIGTALLCVPSKNTILYIASTLIGFMSANIGYSLLFRKRKQDLDPSEMEDSFDQNTELVEDKYSFNFPFKFRYKHKMHKGWINTIAPFRASVIMGTPGAGKTYSLFEPIIEQACKKGYSMFLYDYKFDSLTRIAYNELKTHQDCYKVKPKFGVINFKDPRYSNRCNPLRPEYITDPADTTEIADTIMLNINKGAETKEDFFSMSAKVYLDALIWYLKIYEGGKYCTFPHVIELMGQDYKKVFEILRGEEDLEVKITPFINALEGGAQDQLQGQIASAQIPLNKFVSPILYWILSANEISLDINNPDEPYVLCIGNDPLRQSIYGTTLALFTSQMFKVINNPGKLHSAIILDELPTIFLKGLDNLINTARSNKVAIFLGMQDKSQINRDYGQKEAEVILRTVGNHFVGQVSGETAKDYSSTFGKEKRMNVSLSQGEDNESQSISYHEEEILPINKIQTMSQGQFFGWVCDNNSTKIDKKFFCGDIVRPAYNELQKQRKEAGWSDIPVINDFGYEDIKKDVEERIDEFIFEETRKKIQERLGPTASQTRIYETAKEEFAKIMENEEQVEKYKEIILKKEWDRVVNETITENFKQIKRDIKELVETEYEKVIVEKNRKHRAEVERRRRESINATTDNLLGQSGGRRRGGYRDWKNNDEDDE